MSQPALIFEPSRLRFSPVARSPINLPPSTLLAPSGPLPTHSLSLTRLTTHEPLCDGNDAHRLACSASFGTSLISHNMIAIALLSPHFTVSLTIFHQIPLPQLHAGPQDGRGPSSSQPSRFVLSQVLFSLASTLAPLLTTSFAVTTLLKPSFFASSPLAFENLPKDTSFATDAIPRIEAKSDAPSRSQALNFSGVGELMQFTTGSEFYLSDSFTFYLHISNESDQIAKSIIVVVAIKDPQSNNKTVLDTSTTPKEKLDPQNQSDYIIRFHLSEPGSHVLGIKVQYNTPLGEVRSLTKHFKFTVSKPAAVESTLVSPLPVRPSSRLATALLPLTNSL